jgi:hypothetical protein
VLLVPPRVRHVVRRSASLSAGVSYPLNRGAGPDFYGVDGLFGETLGKFQAIRGDVADVFIVYPHTRVRMRPASRQTRWALVHQRGTSVRASRRSARWSCCCQDQVRATSWHGTTPLTCGSTGGTSTCNPAINRCRQAPGQLARRGYAAFAGWCARAAWCCSLRLKLWSSQPGAHCDDPVMNLVIRGPSQLQASAHPVPTTVVDGECISAL